jgi:hypothetical protein
MSSPSVVSWFEAYICIGQCTTYHSHSIVTLVLGALTTTTTLIVPIPMIPTPRKFLLAVMLFLGTFVLVSGILARFHAMSSPTSSKYLSWLVAETALTILFANLPFLIPLVTMTAPARVSQLSSTLSLSQWPRPYKDTPPLRAQHERLNSVTSTISTLSPSSSHPFESMTSTLYQIDNDDGWSIASPTTSVPPTPVRQLTLTDPPPELEVYWMTRRHSTRDTDLEKMGQQQIQWPYR